MDEIGKVVHDLALAHAAGEVLQNVVHRHAVLRLWRRQKSAEWLTHSLPRPEWMFPSSRGTALDESNVRKGFNAILDEAELHRRGPHQMRHSCASQKAIDRLDDFTPPLHTTVEPALRKTAWVKDDDGRSIGTSPGTLCITSCHLAEHGASGTDRGRFIQRIGGRPPSLKVSYDGLNP